MATCDKHKEEGVKVKWPTYEIPCPLCFARAWNKKYYKKLKELRDEYSKLKEENERLKKEAKAYQSIIELL